MALISGNFPVPAIFFTEPCFFLLRPSGVIRKYPSTEAETATVTERSGGASQGD
jgi:hypothetical protein